MRWTRWSPGSRRTGPSCRRRAWPRRRPSCSGWPELLGAAGVTRISAIGAMSSPEAGWHHDGRFNLLDLVRMVEIEQSAEIAADPLAPYAD